MRFLKTEELAVGYDNKAVVEKINFEVLRGQIIAFLGPNGAGKSTILKTLSSLLVPVRGAVCIQNQDILGIKRNVLSKILAVVLTERLNTGFSSAFDVTAMGRYPHTGFLGGLTESDKKMVWQCLRLVNAEAIAHRPFNELSDGEKQKIMLARALAQEPEMIILDEPTTHLDVKHKLEVMSILKSCDMAVLVKNGKIVDFGSPEAIGSNEVISALFDIDGVGFSASMGTIELSNRSEPSAFVVGGGGTAAGVYRLLTKNNVGFHTGIIHKNDLDCHVAETIGVITVTEKPFQKISSNAFNQAKSLLSETSLVVDTGFPVAEINSANQRLVLESLQEGKCVCTLRGEKENSLIYGEWAKKMVCCQTMEEILIHCRGNEEASFEIKNCS